MTKDQKSTPSFALAPDIEQRKGFVDFGPADEKLLAEIGSLLPLEQVVRQFHKQLSVFPEVRAIAEDPAVWIIS